MAKLEKSIWARLHKAGIISTYDRDLRNEQIRKAGPYKFSKSSPLKPQNPATSILPLAIPNPQIRPPQPSHIQNLSKMRLQDCQQYSFVLVSDTNFW